MPKKKSTTKKTPTWFDVNEARRKGVNMALMFCVTVLTDKMGFGQEEVVQFMDGISSLSESVSEGRVNVKDLQQVQLDEYNMDFR